jgi:uncharacterized protein (DUF1800 family)
MSTQGERFTGAAAGLTPQQRARIAAFRFGMGPKLGLIEKLSRSRDAAFQACWDELTGPSARAAAMIPPLHVGGVQLTEEQDAERYLSAVGITDAATHERRNEELGRRYAKHMEPELGFVERLVLFWANHFSMHQFRTWRTRISLGHFERAVIRKNVLGSFPQMLADAISHTALIDYLDNNRNTRRNLNENLARETSSSTPSARPSVTPAGRRTTPRPMSKALPAFSPAGTSTTTGPAAAMASSSSESTSMTRALTS